MNTKKIKAYIAYLCISWFSYTVITFLLDKAMHIDFDFKQLIIKGLIFAAFISLFMTSRYFRIKL